jgi:hypothetical protein
VDNSNRQDQLQVDNNRKDQLQLDSSNRKDQLPVDNNRQISHLKRDRPDREAEITVHKLATNIKMEVGGVNQMEVNIFLL